MYTLPICNFRTNYGIKGIKSHVFGAIAASVKVCFCGQTLPPAADKLWEKSQSDSFPLSIRYPQVTNLIDKYA
jgi:hypothetical protein